MAINNFKAFAIDPNANVMSQADWEALPALLSGFTSGKADASQVNKALRQATFIASAIAQFVSDALIQDILDDGNSQAFVVKLKQAIVNGSVPAGIPMPWATSTPPTGWLKCNGASFNTSTYPLLAKAYPSGVLPDLRGEFIRGWDDGRGVDPARGLLSTQAATKLPSIYTLLGTGSVGTLVTPPINSYPGSNSEIRASDYESDTTGIGAYLSTGQNQLIASGSSGLSSFRVRPRNVAFNYIVRAA